MGGEDGRDKRRRELAVGRFRGENLVSGGFDRARLVDVDVPRVRGDDRVVRPQGAGDGHEVRLCAATRKCTSASGRPQAPRMSAAAFSQWGSEP
jgi:hypothetical protein